MVCIRALGPSLMVLAIAFVLAWSTRAAAVQDELPASLRTPDFWAVTVLLMLGVASAAVAPFWFAGRFVRDLYGVSGTWGGIRFVLRNRFGTMGIRPWMRVQGGSVVDQTDEALTLIGGPGNMIIGRDTAVLLEAAGKTTRTLGPGLGRLEAFERIYDVVDLCPKRSAQNVSAMSLEGIPVHWDVEVRYQVAGPGGGPPPTGAQYPFSPDHVFRAAMQRWVREPGWQGGQDMDWEGQVLAHHCEDMLRSILALRSLDELVGWPPGGGQAARMSIQAELLQSLRAVAPALGAQILKVTLGNLEVDDEVIQQWVKSWTAAWESKSADAMADGEAAYVFAYETVKAKAQMDMVAGVTRELRNQLSTGALSPEDVPQFVLMRLFSVLDRADFAAASRIFFPAETLDALENVRRTLNLASPLPVVGSVALLALPANVVKNGQCVVTATVNDTTGAPLPDGTIVDFSAELGDVAHASRPTSNGQATTFFRAGAQAGDASVLALSGSEFGRVVIPIV